MRNTRSMRNNSAIVVYQLRKLRIVVFAAKWLEAAPRFILSNFACFAWGCLCEQFGQVFRGQHIKLTMLVLRLPASPSCVTNTLPSAASVRNRSSNSALLICPLKHSTITALRAAWWLGRLLSHSTKSDADLLDLRCAAWSCSVAKIKFTDSVVYAIHASAARRCGLDTPDAVS